MVSVVGVICSICHQEVFQLLEREAQLSPKTAATIKCCRRCARRIDLENQERVDAEVMEGMTKTERKFALKDRSREWARSWDGKRVVVTYDVSNGYGSISKKNCRVTGMALTACKEDIGWGRVKVVIEESEYHRISFTVDGHPEVDGYRWGLGSYFVRRGYEEELVIPYCFHVGWGVREEMLLEEFDAEAERLAAEEDMKRRQAEQEREAVKHLGEGI